MAQTRFYHIDHGGKAACLPTLAEALAAAKSSGFVWLDYCQPSREDLAPLADALGLHPLALQDCLDETQLPRVSDFPGNAFVILNSFHYADRSLRVDEVDVFVGEHFLVTVAGLDGAGQPLLAEVLSRIESRHEGAAKGPAFLLHVVMGVVVDQKAAAIETLEEDLDGIEEPLLANPSSFNPADLLHLRRDLLALRKSLFHEREVLARFCRRDVAFVPEKAVVFYRDTHDHLLRLFELTESCRDLVTSLMEIYLSLLNNEMNRLANQTNRSMRRLTLINTIFMPLALLAGIGGMSEWTMMTGQSHWPVAYGAFMLAMAVIGAANYYLLRWLERRD